jgi:hypothetical protein
MLCVRAADNARVDRRINVLVEDARDWLDVECLDGDQVRRYNVGKSGSPTSGAASSRHSEWAGTLNSMPLPLITVLQSGYLPSRSLFLC